MVAQGSPIVDPQNQSRRLSENMSHDLTQVELLSRQAQLPAQGSAFTSTEGVAQRGAMT